MAETRTKAEEKAEEKLNEEMKAYHAAEYARILNLKSVKNAKLREFLKKANLRSWSHRNRICRNIQILKHTIVPHRTNIIAVCFKVTLDTTSCIYAYAYFSYMGTINKDKKKPHASNIVPAYICTGPTFRSQDGEYRGRVLPWRQYEDLFKKYAKVFAAVEGTIVDKLQSGRMSFQTDFYYPIRCSPSKTFENSINDMRLPIKLYILCWIRDFYTIHHKIAENHMNPAYQHIIYQREDIPVFDKIIEKISKHDYDVYVIGRIESIYNDIDAPLHNIVEVGCGQKIFPLSAIEAVKTDDINFNVWREIYITNMASNLVLNLISPSFPFINNWFYIQNAHAGLFDNIAMHDKYVHSEIAADVSAQLKRIDKYNYIEENPEKGPISGKFFLLSNSIHKSVIYADSDIKLTDLAVCMTSEYVGRTLRDIPGLISQHESTSSDLSKVFTDTDIFMKHMFEYVYSFYCMNCKIGIIHGDLHMNNATISRLYTMMGPNDVMYVENPHIAYIVGEDAYVFRHYGLFSMIIDFSRSILGDYEKLEHEFGPRFAEAYFHDQRIRVLQTLYHYFKALVKKYRDEIETLLKNNFALMFKIVSAIDTFVIMSNISAMFSIDDAFTRGKITIAAGAQKILDHLVDDAENLIVRNIQDAIAGKITSVDDIEWPNLTIIKKNFGKYVLTPEKMTPSTNILDIFNSANEMIYDIEGYETWGPLLSLDREIELRKKYKTAPDDGIQRWLTFKHTDESVTIEELTSKYEQQERDVLEYESWMTI